MRSRANLRRRWFVQVPLLMGALGLVVWTALKMKDPAVVAGFAAFFGAEPERSWCPPRLSTVQFIPTGRVLSHRAEIESLCVVPLTTYGAEDLSQARWSPFLRLSVHDREEILEADLERGLFRLGDFPFASPVLRERLRALAGP